MIDNLSSQKKLMENQDEKETKHDTVGWYVFVGCMFVVMGLGMYFVKPECD